jgi:hypothetical protein
MHESNGRVTLKYGMEEISRLYYYYFKPSDVITLLHIEVFLKYL